jgi:membrane associated rhomboid family serine protease
MLMRGGFVQLIGNMLYLWKFGDNVADSRGGPAAACSTCAAGWRPSTVPMIGASRAP